MQDILLANEKLRGAQYGLRTTAGLREQHLPLNTPTPRPASTSSNVSLPESASVIGLSPQQHPMSTDLTASILAEPSELAPVSLTNEETLSVAPGLSTAPLVQVTDAVTVGEAGLAPAAPVAGHLLADYGLHLTGLALSRLRMNTAGQTLSARETIRRSSTPLAAFSPTFRRLLKPFGPYQVGQAGRPLRPTQPEPVVTDAARAPQLPGTSLRQRDTLLSSLAQGVITAAPTRTERVRAYQFNDDVVDRLLRKLTEAPAPLTLFENGQPAAEDVKSRFNAAFSAFKTTGPTTTLGFRKLQYVRPPLALDALKQAVITGTEPGPVFVARVQQASPLVPIPPVRRQADFEARDFNGDDFYVDEETVPTIADDFLGADFRAADFRVGNDTGPNEGGAIVLAATLDAPEHMVVESALPSLALENEAAMLLSPDLVEAAIPLSAPSLAPAALAAATTVSTATASPRVAPPIDGSLPVLQQLKVFPVFKDAMGEHLRQRHPALFVPGLGDFPAGGVAVLGVNQAFIEAYMVGLNHALGSELAWRGFPVEGRGTFFQQFWDVSEYRHTKGTAESALLDILPLDQWHNSLGQHRPPTTTSPPLRLVLRSELLRRYPTLVLGLQASVYDASTQTYGPDPDYQKLVLPRQRLPVGQDLVIVTFDLLLSQASALPEDGGYYLTLLERPGQPQFGLDEHVSTGTATDAPLSWNDLSWEYVGTQPGAYLRIDSVGKPYASTEPDSVQHLTDSAVVAYALFQAPILATIALSELGLPTS